MEDSSRSSIKPIGIVEAKCEDFPPDYGLEQAKLYADRFQKKIRFVFSTNGHEFVLFDRLKGITIGPQPMDSFPTAQELKTKYINNPGKDKHLSLPRIKNGEHKIDPSSVEHAQSVIENILPDVEVRRSCLLLMAESIRYAFSLAPGNWAVTLPQSARYIRFNVGQIEVCALAYNIVHLILDNDTLPVNTRQKLEQYTILNGPTAYVKVPSSVLCDFRAENLAAAKPLLWESYRSLIRKASKHGTSWAHSTGTIDYLRRETQIELHNPIPKQR